MSADDNLLKSCGFTPKFSKPKQGSVRGISGTPCRVCCSNRGYSERAQLPSQERTISVAALLREHPFARALYELGTTDEQLNRIAFFKIDASVQISAWKIIVPEKFPFSPGFPSFSVAMHLARAYCALKWELSDEARGEQFARNREEARDYVARVAGESNFEIGKNARNAQQARARKPRVRLADGTDTMHEIIEQLLAKPEHLNSNAKGLWPHLYAVLDETGAAALREGAGRKGDPTYIYSVNGKSRTIGLRRFANIVSNIRKKSRLAGLS